MSDDLTVIESPGERFPEHSKPGLAVDKKKILQVNLKDKDNPHPYVLFEYYTEYGDDGMTIVHSFDENGRHTSVLPVEALMVFVDQFRKELESK